MVDLNDVQYSIWVPHGWEGWPEVTLLLLCEISGSLNCGLLNVKIDVEIIVVRVIFRTPKPQLGAFIAFQLLLGHQSTLVHLPLQQYFPRAAE